MPPSVARSQLPMTSAHATKEPPQAGAVAPFLDGCCTNNTRPTRKLRRNPLFCFKFLEKCNLLTRALRRRPASPLFYRQRREAQRISCGNHLRIGASLPCSAESKHDISLMEAAIPAPARRCRKDLFYKGRPKLRATVKCVAARRAKIESREPAMRGRFVRGCRPRHSLLRIRSISPCSDQVRERIDRAAH